MAATGSGNVLVNGMPWTRFGDITAVHVCQETVKPYAAIPHVGVYLGVRNVLVNGMPGQTSGDMTDCTSIVLMGSPNVITGS
jgi:uncharacterized Zn-binding protein involved in type VI secretion